MPMVTIKWVEGRTQEMRDAVARRVSEAIHEESNTPLEAVWIVFEDVKAAEWYTGGKSIGAQRAAAKPATTAAPAPAKGGRGKKAGSSKKAASAKKK